MTHYNTSLTKLKRGTIYALIDLNTFKPFYIGHTIRVLSLRLMAHKIDARKELGNLNNVKKCSLIKGIDFNVSICELEKLRGNKYDFLDREIFWINKLSVEGYSIVNVRRSYTYKGN